MPEKSSRFTGRQLTVVVASVAAAAVLTPTAVYAAATIVQLSDPYSGSKARVFSGKVAVGDGSGALTVDGAVSSKLPSGAFSTSVTGTDTTRAVLRVIPPNVGVVISSLTVAYYGGGTGDVQVTTFTPNSAGDCTGPGLQDLPRIRLYVPVGDTRNVNYAGGFILPKSASSRCLIANTAAVGGGSLTAYITTTGFQY
jgi:hypothetical protein